MSGGRVIEKEVDKNTYSCSDLTDFVGDADIISPTELTIQNGATRISKNGFSNCRGLIKLTISTSVTEIGEEAFSGCTGLTEVTIQNGVTKIGGRAFESCTGLTEVTIPASVTEIGLGAFWSCSGLARIRIVNPELVREVYMNPGWYFNKGQSISIASGEQGYYELEWRGQSGDIIPGQSMGGNDPNNAELDKAAKATTETVPIAVKGNMLVGSAILGLISFGLMIAGVFTGGVGFLIGGAVAASISGFFGGAREGETSQKDNSPPASPSIN